MNNLYGTNIDLYIMNSNNKNMIDISKLFNEVFDNYISYPMKDTGEAYEASVALPGVKKSELSIKYQKGLIELNVKNSKFYDDFVYRLSVSNNVKAKDIQAVLENGVLSIKVEKPPKDLPQDIEVKSS